MRITYPASSRKCTSWSHPLSCYDDTQDEGAVGAPSDTSTREDRGTSDRVGDLESVDEVNNGELSGGARDGHPACLVQLGTIHVHGE